MKNHSNETTTGDSQEDRPASTGTGERVHAIAPATQGMGASDILKLLTAAVQTAGGSPVAVKATPPCTSSDKDSPSFGAISEKLVEAVTAANSGAAGNGEMPFSMLYQLSGKQLSDDLADRSKRPRLVSEILAAQIRDNALACELLNSSLYGMKHEDIQKSLALGKGVLQNTLELRHRCEKAVRSAAETLSAVDEVLYPKVKIRQKRSIKVRMAGPGKQRVTMARSTVHEHKKNQLQ